MRIRSSHGTDRQFGGYLWHVHDVWHVHCERRHPQLQPPLPPPPPLPWALLWPPLPLRLCSAADQVTDRGMHALSVLPALTFVDLWKCGNVSKQQISGPCCLAGLTCSASSQQQLGVDRQGGTGDVAFWSKTALRYASLFLKNPGQTIAPPGPQLWIRRVIIP